MDTYAEFLSRKSQVAGMSGFEPLWMPDFLFDFQRHLVDWAIRKGRAAIFADCLSGDSVINSPDGDVTIEEAYRIGKPLRVFSFSDGKVRVSSASRPFVAGVDRLYRYSFSSGRSIAATAGHRFLTIDGWQRGDSLAIGQRILAASVSRPRSIGERVQSVRHEDDRRWFRTIPGCSDRCSVCSCLCGELPHFLSDIVQGSLPSRVDVREHIRHYSCSGDSESRSEHTHRCPVVCRLSTVRFGLQVATTVEDVEFPPLSFGPSCSHESSRTFLPVGGESIPAQRVLESLPSATRWSEVCQYEPCDFPPVVLDTLSAVDYIKTDVYYDIEVPEIHCFFANEILSHNCGLGKSPMMLVFAENVVRRTNKPVLILTPLAVSHQLVREAEKFGIEAYRAADGKPRPNITVTNYERLDKFDPEDYSGAVLDEASIIKHWTGHTQKVVTRFLSKLQYRLLCTATPAPNDYVEMGTASEALGELTHSDMLGIFFRQISDDEKKKRATSDDIIHSKRLSWRVIQSMGQWALKSHAFEPFWKWVASWARACRKPSDLGDFDDSKFILPPLNRRDHTVTPRTPPDGWLFTVPAFGLNQERAERRRTLDERSELVVKLTKDSDCAVVWCHLNPEGDRLEKDISGSIQVKGSQSMDEKEERILSFLNGQSRVLVTKEKIAGLGLNLQHCAHVVTFVTHSWEKFYQSVRRCWRFGQQRPVTLDVIATEGEVNVRKNMDRKEKLASIMFDSVIEHMNDAMTVRANTNTLTPEIPSWLSRIK